MSGSLSGHVHVIAGDLRRLFCDAWLLPTDRAFRISWSFATEVGVLRDERLAGYEWGGGRVVRFRGKEQPQVWLGDVGALGEPANWYADIVGPFVAAAAAELRMPPGRRPLLALPVLGTGEGGMLDAKGEVHYALFRSLYAAAEKYGVDLVLVCWGRRAYSAAQRIRRRFIDEERGGRTEALWDLGAPSKPLIERAKRLAGHAQRGTLVLFMGAGTSTGAGLPAWKDLLEGIARRAGFDEAQLKKLHRLDPRDQARLLGARLKMPASLQDEVAHDMGQARYSLVHGLLASLNVTEAVTTNYDVLYEKAVDAAGGPVRAPLAVLPYEPVEPGGRWLLKLHGSIEHRESVVMTRDDYLSVPTRQGALFGLVQALLMTRHMLFVGYSLSDEDFHQVIYEVRLARAGAREAGEFGTVMIPFEDALMRQLWEGDLEVVPLCPELDHEATQHDWYAQTRQLQEVLDLVGYLASDLDAFLLDPTYNALLDERERAVAQSLRPLLERYTDIDPDEPPVAARLRDLLKQLGG